MAAAGVSRDDFLAIADAYASALSTFSPGQPRDEVCSHSAKQDVEDNLKGYDLYESGRIRQSKRAWRRLLSAAVLPLDVLVVISVWWR
jgi:hypothetical protein